MKVRELDDDKLIDGFGEWIGRDRRVTAAVLVFIAEIDERRAYAELGDSSTFSFYVERFHMSESAAGKRIHAARTARRFPVIFEMVARGELHLSGINRLAAHLTEENHAAVLCRARHRSTRQIEELVAEIAPRPDVPPRIRALPLPRAPESHPTPFHEPAAAGTHVDAPSERAGAEPGGHATAPPPLHELVPPVGRVSPLAPRRYKIELTVGEETMDALRALQGLLPDRDPAVIFDRAIGELLQRTLARKAGLTSRSRAAAAEPTQRSRHIPAGKRREVWLRDGGRCAFVGSDGRCTETDHLEFHHRRPFALGGTNDADNLELRCRTHNQHQADLDYGKAFMDGKRYPTELRETLFVYHAQNQGSSTELLA